jgi:hypothetical protein
MKEHQRTDLDQPDLLELLRMDDAAFKLHFAGTPMLRTKRRGVLRNVCVALGNVGDERLPALEQATRDPEPLIVEHARWAIEQVRKRTTSVTASAALHEFGSGPVFSGMSFGRFRMAATCSVFTAEALLPHSFEHR